LVNRRYNYDIATKELAMKWIVGIAVTWFLFHTGIAQALLLAIAGLGTIVFG
jgi:hypothetical protein